MELNGRLVGFGKAGTVVSSSNAETWTAHPTGQTFRLEGMAYGNGIYLAFGAGNRLLMSSDLESWTLDRPENVPSSSTDILFSEGKFWLCGSDSTVSSSVDGITWAAVQLDEESRRLPSIAYGGGLFMVVDKDGFVSTSPDGQVWTVRPTGLEFEENGDAFGSVYYRNERFVVRASDAFLSSTDGVTWTKHENKPAIGAANLLYENGHYYATGVGGNVFRSPDLERWEEVATGIFIYFEGIASLNGTIAVVGAIGTIATSTDFTNWTDRQESLFVSINEVKFINGKFILSTYLETLYQSEDSETWTEFYTAPFRVNDFVHADGKWVVVGRKGETVQSLDGVTWSSPSPSFEGFVAVLGIRYFDGKWFVFGGDGLLRSSTNLTDWDVLDPDNSTQFREMIFENGLFVLVGSDGKIFTSSDGVDFVSRETAATREFRTVAYGNGRYVAAGLYFDSFSSIDGITWSDEGVRRSPNLNALSFKDGRFIGLGINGGLHFSPDGRTWETKSLGYSNFLYNIVEGNGRLVISGSGELLLSTDQLPERALTLATVGEGTIVNAADNTTFLDGATATLTATPADGWGFTGWSGDAFGTENPLTITVDADKAITATFARALSGYDLWRASEFNAAERGDDAISGKSADPDLDGRSNLHEFYFISRPKSPDAHQILSYRNVDLGGGDYPVVSFRRRADVGEVSERVEISHDLITWRDNESSGTIQTIVLSLEDNGDGSETVSHRTQDPLGANAKTFFRIVME